MSPTLQTVLLTGFEPFGGESVNPSWRVAQALAADSARSDGLRVLACELPCAFGHALAALHEALQQAGPGLALVLALGQASGRCDFSFERVAINIDDAPLPDNSGAQPIDEPVVAGAPAAFFSSLPIKAMVAALRAAGLPASVSQSAGTFVCNHVFFGLMHALQTRPGVRGGFMHLPLLPEQAARRPGAASLPLATLVEGTRLALQTALATRAELRAGGGAEA